MRLIQYFNKLFPAPPSTAKAKKEKKKEAVWIVSLLSRGNVSLQNGRFITSKEISKRRNKVLRYKF